MCPVRATLSALTSLTAMAGSAARASLAIPAFLAIPLSLTRPTSLAIPVSLVVSAVLTLPGGLAGQQVVDPSVRVMSRVLLENDVVLVVENTYEPGGVTEEHTHAFPRTVYVVSGGILELVAPDGTATQIEVRRGQALWRPSETHVVRNVGPTRVRVVETEIKGAPGP